MDARGKLKPLNGVLLQDLFQVCSRDTMDYKIEMAGKKFGRWTVKSFTGVRHHEWLCVCDCGTERPITGLSLRNGMSQSCGCLKGFTSGLHHKLLPDERRLRNKLIVYKCSARHNNREWLLSDEYARKILTAPC